MYFARPVAGADPLLKVRGVVDVAEACATGCIYVFVRPNLVESEISAIRNRARLTWNDRHIVIAIRSPIRESGETSRAPIDTQDESSKAG